MVSERKNIYGDRTFYHKSGGKSYLVIRSGEEPELPYQINMIRYNNIAGLLPVQFFIEDGEYQYFYDISCKESLFDRMRQKKYSTKEIRTIMSDLYRCVQQMEEYLLDTNCLILEPEYLYTDKDSFHIQFCFYQDKKETFEQSLEKLFDYFLNQLDYQDEKTVLLAYSLYQKSREEHIPLYELMKQFCEFQEPEKNQEKTEICYEDSENCGKDWGTEQKNDVKEIKRISKDSLNKENVQNIPAKMGMKDFHLKKVGAGKFVPYIPDLIGGYGIARILWYISQNHARMPGKTFMFWMLAIAGIMIGCGIFSTFLSGFLDKEGDKQIDKRLEEKVTIQKKEQVDHYCREKKEGPDSKTIKYSQNMSPKNRENNLDHIYEEQFQKMECESDEEKKEFEEFGFEDVIESQDKNESSIPATVVMSEPELFRAFNPVLISKNKDQFQDIVIKDRSMVVGKVRGIADICLDGRSISRIHARIDQDKKGCSVTDLGSTNGTFINGIRLAERQIKYLKQADEVRFAEAVFEFQSQEAEILHSQRMEDVI